MALSYILLFLHILFALVDCVLLYLQYSNEKHQRTRQLMHSINQILLDHSLAIINAVAVHLNMDPFDSAKLSGISNRSQSIYFDATRKNEETFTEFRFSDHDDKYADLDRVCVHYSRLIDLGLICEHADFEGTFDHDMDYEEWLSNPNYNDNAFIFKS